MTCTIDLQILQGKTFEFAFRWADPIKLYKPITGATATAPVVLTVPGHGLSDGWPFEVQSVKTPPELNTQPGQFYLAKVLTPDSLELNDVNGIGFKAFGGAGTIVFYTPADLTGLAARFAIRRTPGDADALLTGSTTDGRVVIDIPTSTISIVIGADVTATLDWNKALYDLELYDPADLTVVYPVASGRVTVTAEVAK